MKVILTAFLLFIATLSSGQNFTLTDTIVKIGDVLRSKIYFDFDRPVIREESKLFLDSLGRYLIQNPKLRLEVSNHCDTRVADAYIYRSMRLTQRRAGSVTFYLINKHAIHPSRLVAKGYADSKPIITESQINRLPKDKQEEAHSKNRRTEFAIIEILK